MLHIECHGTPFEIGYHHGQTAKDLVARNIDFSSRFIQGNTQRSQADIEAIALQLGEVIQRKWPRYYEELSGLAAGAQRSLAEILMLNTRTELGYGLAGDGCTSAYHKDGSTVLQGQNWDFLLDAKHHLIQLTISQPGLPTIKMITEAGLIGKIGLNSAGVTVNYNALHVRGFNAEGLPSHLALRMALESVSAADAVERISAQGGMAASAFILVGDGAGARGIEFTYCDIRVQEPDACGNLVHTNHCLLEHEAQVVETDPLPDSWSRARRAQELLGRLDGMRAFERIWEDEDGYPMGICRALQYGKSRGATLFNIVTDLQRKRAVVRVGRPVEGEVEETFVLEFDD